MTKVVLRYDWEETGRRGSASGGEEVVLKDGDKKTGLAMPAVLGRGSSLTPCVDENFTRCSSKQMAIDFGADGSLLLSHTGANVGGVRRRGADAWTALSKGDVVTLGDGDAFALVRNKVDHGIFHFIYSVHISKAAAATAATAAATAAAAVTGAAGKTEVGVEAQVEDERTSAPAPKKRKVECKYGGNCYDNSTAHAEKFAHPVGWVPASAPTAAPVAALAPATSGPAAGQQQQQGKGKGAGQRWLCPDPICLRHNPADASFCSACHIPRPGGFPDDGGDGGDGGGGRDDDRRLDRDRRRSNEEDDSGNTKTSRITANNNNNNSSNNNNNNNNNSNRNNNGSNQEFTLLLPPLCTIASAFDPKKAARITVASVHAFLTRFRDGRIRIVMVNDNNGTNKYAQEVSLVLRAATKGRKSEGNKSSDNADGNVVDDDDDDAVAPAVAGLQEDGRFEVMTVAGSITAMPFPASYLVNTTNWRFKAGGEGTNLEVCRAAGPVVENECKRQYTTAFVGAAYPIALPEDNAFRMKSGVKHIINVVGPNLNPQRPDCLDGDYTTAADLLRQCHDNVFKCFARLSGLSAASKPPPSQQQQQQQQMSAHALMQAAQSLPPPPPPPPSAPVQPPSASSASSASKQPAASAQGSGSGSGSGSGGVTTGYVQPRPRKLTEAEMGGKWDMALRAVATHQNPAARFPDHVYKQDEQVVVTYDVFPKARCHLLVMPRKIMPSQIDSLDRSNLPLLRHMQQVATACVAEIGAKDPSLQFRIGYHAVPSLKQLHCHVISQDFDSECMKEKHHYHSFTTAFFVDSAKLIAHLEEHGKTVFNRAELVAAKDKKDLKCHVKGCRAEQRSMAELKAHLLLHYPRQTLPQK